MLERVVYADQSEAKSGVIGCYGREEVVETRW